jgi:glycosyltransferase involved in cell wall biosynthesis
MIHGETHLAAAIALKKRFHVPVLYAHRSNTVRESIVALSDSDTGMARKLRLLFDVLHFRNYERKIARACDALVFQSPYDLNDFCERNPRAKEKSYIVRGNIGLPRFTPETAMKNRSASLRKILFVGTLGNRKGVRHLFAAFDLLDRRGIHDLELDVIGPGETIEYWKEWARAHGMESRVRIHGRVSNPFDFLEKSDLLVVPSDFDSYPDTVLEALHVGIPVIGSMAGGIPDMLEYPELLFPIQDHRTIAEILAHAHDDARFYLKLRELCSARTSFFHFDWAPEWEKVMKKTAKVKMT